MWEVKNVNFANVAISSTETEMKMLVPYLTSNPDELLPQCTTRVDSDYQIGGNCGEVNAVAVTLDRIIEEYKINEIDILDIDVEGFELDVWRSLTKIKPKVVIVEYDTQGVIKTECRDAILDTNEYNLAHTTKINDIFMLKVGK
jgi:FkbM family methyltransferase